MTAMTSSPTRNGRFFFLLLAVGLIVLWHFDGIAFDAANAWLSDDTRPKMIVVEVNNSSESDNDPSQSDNDSSEWDLAILEAKDLLSETAGEPDLPSCLIPDRSRTAAVVQNAVAKNHSFAPFNIAHKLTREKQTAYSLLPLPVINVGMPKMGSTTLFEFFGCNGFSATHHWRNVIDFEGICMRDAVMNGLPPLASCAKGKDALMQIDVENPFGYDIQHQKKNQNRFHWRKTRDECFFPQMSLLHEIHEEAPNATFVIAFRPIKDWIKSMAGWNTILKRLRMCTLPNKPRLIPENLDNDTEALETYTQFFCSHVIHLRNFVNSHPSHALIELELYNTKDSKEVMGTLFPSLVDKPSKSCWGKANTNPPKKKQQARAGSMAKAKANSNAKRQT